MVTRTSARSSDVQQLPAHSLSTLHQPSNHIDLIFVLRVINNPPSIYSSSTVLLVFLHKLSKESAMPAHGGIYYTFPIILPNIPVIKKRIIEVPVIKESVIEVPVIKESVIKELVIEELVIEEPVIEEPVIEEPVIEEPVIEEPVIEEPVIEESVIEEPVIEEPVIEEPVIEEPVIEEPVIEEPVIEEAVIREAVIREAVIREAVIREAVIREAVIREAVIEELVIKKPVIKKNKDPWDGFCTDFLKRCSSVSSSDRESFLSSNSFSECAFDDFDNISITDPELLSDPEEDQRCPAVLRMIKRSLSKAKVNTLRCSKLLLPNDLLYHLGQELIHMAYNEPCGLRGAVIDLCVENRKTCYTLSQINVDSSVVPTFHLTILFKVDSRLWSRIQGLFSTKSVPGFGQTLKLSNEFKVLKKKLYSSEELVLEEC